VEAYCLKCKQKREMVDPTPTFTKGGTPATKGTCAVCGTTLFRMGRTEAHAGLQPPPVEKRPAGRSKKARGGKRAKVTPRKGRLVIVESPAKARTVGRFLGPSFAVRASVGHVRDLLRSKLSVDVENDFAPTYRVPNEKREVVKGLKKEAGKAEEIYLATDPDREGEAIAWHLMHAADIEPERTKRVVFHEITEPAIDAAFHAPRPIDMNLVNAQQARRILDRLVGYNLGPLLWAKVRPRLSAGRVQSAALRLVVDREREIRDFVPREYWTIKAQLLQPAKPPACMASLAKIDGQDPDLGSQDAVTPVLEDMRAASYRVLSVKRGSRSRRPWPPFITSTLQQEASGKLGFGARKTMAVAQQLYEGIELGSGEAVGLITYMRTDSTQLAAQAQQEARRVIASRYGEEFLPGKPPYYAKKARGAQEAHEAIRPTSARRDPQSVSAYLTPDQAKLYDLIWRRFIASQMKPAEFDTMTIQVEGTSAQHVYGLRVSGSSLRFEGYLRVYGGRAAAREAGKEGEDEEEIELEQLPTWKDGDVLELQELFPEQHFTQPPARYSDASLIRALEEHGIGRPSTYAPTLTTLQQRGYVRRESRRLIPTDIGVLVNDLIVEHFPDIVDLNFTARMEDELDDIAQGSLPWVEVIREFYGPFAEEVERAKEAMPEVKAEPEMLDRRCPECGGQLIVRYGRFGKFVGCANYPACRHTEPWLEKIGMQCPKDGGEIVVRRTRKGRTFYGCTNYPACDFTSWKLPLPQRCEVCGGLLVQEGRNRASCIQCGARVSLKKSEAPQSEMA
jgi:DNA topoisomerase-1